MEKLRKKKIEVTRETSLPECPPLHTVNWKKYEAATKLPNGRWHVVLERVNDKRDIFPAYCECIDGEWYLENGDELASVELFVTHYDHPPRIRG